jgi:hypothetical protein
MTVFSSREKLELKEFLEDQGFVFEKRKLRKPGTKEIKEITVGTRVLDQENHGHTVIGINLDSERDQWFVAPTWEASQLSPVTVPEIKDEKLKLDASAFVSKVKQDLKTIFKTSVKTPEENEPQTSDPEKEKPPKTYLPICDSPLKEPAEQSVKPFETTKTQISAKPQYDGDPALVQVIKNVGQAKIALTKNTKGYSWEITSYADSMNDAIDQAIAADQRLKIQFGSGI